MTRRAFVAGNWKMHGVAADLDAIGAIAEGAADFAGVDCALCLPATLIERAARRAPGFAIGGQDVHSAPNGAHTGDISAMMLLDAGASLTIVGHSERRASHAEKNGDVRAKAAAALESGLSVILCVGETLDVREQGAAIAFVADQLAASLPALPADPARLTIAYEPIWAIGTGRVASVEDIDAMHRALRERLSEISEAAAQSRILYGGSVKASNAPAIFAVADVDGALVGGASLSSEDFLPIVAAAS